MAAYDVVIIGGGVSGLLLHAQQIAPALADATFRRAWVGLRPASPNGAPILGPLPGWEGVSVATGHTAEGVLLSPITGGLMVLHSSTRVAFPTRSACELPRRRVECLR